MNNSSNSRAIILGACIISCAIVAASWIVSRAPHYIRLDSGEWLNQTDGTTYEYLGQATGLEENATTERYHMTPGPGSSLSNIEDKPPIRN